MILLYQINFHCDYTSPFGENNKAKCKYCQALISDEVNWEPNYNIHLQLHFPCGLSRYIWNVTVTYLDTFMNNHVSRYITVSEHISM